MTHALGAGTVNAATNIPEDEARIHGRIACEMDISRGDLFRQAILEWYERHRPDLAAKIETIRRNHREIGSALLLVLFLCYLPFATGSIRRAPRRIEIEEIA